MVLYVHNENPNAFVRAMRQVYNPIGFKKGYNFILFFIFGGALLGFTLARLQYLSIDGVFKKGAAPGEFFYYSRHFYKVAIALHLCCILPAAFLAIWQFVPIIRHKALILHRINGYVILLLLLLGEVGALMVARRAFGGTIDTQTFVGVLAIMTLGSAILAYTNIKRLQIDQHRAWMLRCWFYAGCIITTRLIMILSTMIISIGAKYYMAMPCKQIAYMGGDVSNYVACRADPNGFTADNVNFNSPQGVEQVTSGMQMTFGASAWLAFWIHAIGIEVYLRLTPAEGERLRKVSYERQLERGMSHPGSAGLTVDRLGDAARWTPPKEEKETEAEKVLSDSESTSSGERHLGWH